MERWFTLTEMDFILVRKMLMSTYSLMIICWLCVMSPFFCLVVEHSKKNIRQSSFLSITVFMSQSEPEGHKQFLLMPATAGLQRRLCSSLQCQKNPQTTKIKCGLCRLVICFLSSCSWIFTILLLQTYSIKDYWTSEAEVVSSSQV